MACIGLINGYRRCATAPKYAPKTVKKRHEITSYTARYGKNRFYDARYILLLLCKPNTIYSGFDTKYALDMYRKSAYNRKYRKRKAKAFRLCRRGETEREVKRMIRYIVKRSGDKVSFDARKIKSAIFKANTRIAAERMSDADLNELTEDVLTALEKLPGTPTAQEIQNVVEEKLLAADYAKTANAYINYRTEHEHLREMDDELVAALDGAANPSSDHWLTVRGTASKSSSNQESTFAGTPVTDAPDNKEITHWLKYHQAAYQNATDMGSTAVNTHERHFDEIIDGDLQEVMYFEGRMSK
jgi:transcriptional regulator NrdR family protein